MFILYTVDLIMPPPINVADAHGYSVLTTEQSNRVHQRRWQVDGVEPLTAELNAAKT